MHNNSVSFEGGYLFELPILVKLKLCIQICLRWYYCNSCSAVIASWLFTPSASFPPVILTLPYFFPLVQNNSITPLLVLFSDKSRSLVFSSSSTLIHPGILGLTVYSGISFIGKPRTQLQECGWSFWAHSLFTVPSCWKIPRVSSVHC